MYYYCGFTAAEQLVELRDLPSCNLRTVVREHVLRRALGALDLLLD